MLDLYNKKLLIWDFETEGLSPLYTRPWQLGFCVYEKNKEIFSYSAYLKWPNLKVSPGAARATGYDPVKVEKEGKDPREVLDILWQYMYDDSYVVAGHNVLGYDVQINNVSRRELGLKPDFSFVPRILDSNAIARGIKLGMLPKKDEDFIAWQYKMLNVRAKGVRTNIKSLCEEFNIEFDEFRLHEALYDVQKNHSIFLELDKRLKY